MTLAATNNIAAEVRTHGLDGQWLSGPGPFEWLGHGAIEVVDEALDAVLEIGLGEEAGAAQQLAHQDGEPDFDLIEPGGVLGCEVEGDAVACDRAGKPARLALVARTPSRPLRPSAASLMPHWRATSRTTASDMWMSRLSQTMRQDMVGAAEAKSAARKAAKSCSVRVSAMLPPTLPVTTSR